MITHFNMSRRLSSRCLRRPKTAPTADPLPLTDDGHGDCASGKVSVQQITVSSNACQILPS